MIHTSSSTRSQGRRLPLGKRSILLLALSASACTTGAPTSVDPTSGGGTGLDVAPVSSFTSSGPEGGPFADSTTYTVTNGDGEALSWTADTDQPWIDVAPASGTLSVGSQEQVVVSIDDAIAASLPAGVYQATVSFTNTNTGGVDATRAVDLTVIALGAGSLDITPVTEFQTGGPVGGPFAPAARSFTLSNSGSSTLDWTAAADVSWLLFSPASGTLAAGTDFQVSADVDVPAAGALGAGSYSGTITFSDTTNGVFVTVPVRLAIGTTTIENDAWFSVQGSPFFPIGAFNQPGTASQISYLKGLGLNTIWNNGVKPPEPTNQALMDLLEANDMWGIMQFDSSLIGHPRLLAWSVTNEPDNKNIPPADVQDEYDAIKAADPNHLVGLNIMGRFYWDGNWGSPSFESSYQAYAAITDFVAPDHYPVTGWNRPEWVYMPGAMTEFLLDRYVDHGKPVGWMVESSDQRLPWTPPQTPGPTPEQMRFEVWDCIIHGATSIYYFTIAFDPFEWSNHTPAIDAELVRTNGQIQALSDVILSPAPALNVSSAEASGKDHNFTVRKAGDVYYLFADNADMGYQSATLTFTFDQPPSSIDVYDEGRSITPNGNSFSDAFGPLGVHIYEIRF